MSIVLILFLLVAILIIWFGAWAALRVIKPGLAKEAVNRVILRVFAGVLALVATEQMVLAFGVNPALVRRDADIRAVIDKVMAQPGGLAGGVGLHQCETRKAVAFYSYKICLIDGFSEPNSEVELIHVYIAFPVAVLTIIPSEWGGVQL